MSEEQIADIKNQIRELLTNKTLEQRLSKSFWTKLRKLLDEVKHLENTK